MFSALFSFLGGSVFRMIWGEVSNFINKKQDQQHEIERMTLQSSLDDKSHTRTLENLRLQAELNVQQVTVQGEADQAVRAADAFTEAMKTAFTPIGIPFIDGWNGLIRPITASIALALWTWAFVGNGFILTEWDRELMGVALGFFFADRSLGKRGK
jgi:hypothetical protein